MPAPLVATLQYLCITPHVPPRSLIDGGRATCRGPSAVRDDSTGCSLTRLIGILFLHAFERVERVVHGGNARLRMGRERSGSLDETDGL